MPVKRKGDLHNIWIRVSFLCKRYTYYLPYMIAESGWDSARNRAKPNYQDGHVSGAKINKHIRESIAAIEDYFDICEAEDLVPTPNRLKELLDSKEKLVKRLDMTPFEQVFDEFVTTQSVLKSWSADTITKMRGIEKHILAYNQKVTMQDFTEKHLAGLIKHFEDCGMVNNTIQKKYDLVKWFLKWAYQHKYLTTNDHELFKPKLKGVTKTPRADLYLTWDELMRLHDIDLGKRHRGLEAVRDVFLFQCFTGLRYSDVLSLKKINVNNDCIRLTTQKTADNIVINLNDWSREIINKYSDITINKPKYKDMLLPVISNQKMNKEIKTLCMLAHINDPIEIVRYRGNARVTESKPKYDLISSHCGRRTFIVHAIRLGIPVPVIMQYTGHSSYDAMKPYINVVDDSKEKEMKKFNKESKK